MTELATPRPPASAIETLGRRWMPAAMLACLLTVLLLQLVTTTRSVLVLVHYPFGVDYGEGIVWQQMLNILDGRGYSPLGTYPAIVYHYPPMFHLVTAGLSAALGLDGLAAGRWVSWLSTLGTAALIGRLAWLGRAADDAHARAITALLAGLIFLGCDPVMAWCATMRVDMLAGLFGMAGLAVALQSLRRPAAIYWAALLFTAALFTKQVSIAAPIAAWTGLLFTTPRQAWRLAAATSAMSALGLAVATWMTNGGFVTHVFLYNINRFRPDLIEGLANPLQVHGIYIVLAAAGACRLFKQWWRERGGVAPDLTRAAAGASSLTFLLLKTLMLAMVMKSGASSNYLLEWCAALALAAAFALGPIVGAATKIGKEAEVSYSPFFIACLLGVVSVQAINLWRRPILPEDTVAPAHTMWRLVDLIKHSSRPVISDEMTLLIRAGRPVEWEPAIAAELGAQGRYDEAGFIRLIKARYFGLFITAGGPGIPVFDSRYNRPVLSTLQSAYPLTQDIDGFIVRRPAVNP